jgi:hypothetical protein
LQHVKAIVDLIHTNYFFTKHSMCIFGPPSITYLTHIISRNGVAKDGYKVEVVALIHKRTQKFSHCCRNHRVIWYNTG